MSSSKDDGVWGKGLLAAYIPKDISFSTQALIITDAPATLILEGIYSPSGQPDSARNIRVHLKKNSGSLPDNGEHNFPASNIMVEYDGKHNDDFFSAIPGNGLIFLNLDPLSNIYSCAFDISFTKKGSSESFQVISTFTTMLE